VSVAGTRLCDHMLAASVAAQFNVCSSTKYLLF